MAGIGGGRYLAKRECMPASTASLIEIDLLRGGPRLPVVGAPAAHAAPGGRVAAGLRDRLPVVPVPPGRGEPEPALDLQERLHLTYDEAGYGRRIYRTNPDPPLSSADAAWAAGLLRPRVTG